MSTPSPIRAALAAMAILMALPAAAQYKIVGPDGKVTYTDRPPPVAAGSKVSPVRGSGVDAPVAVVLPAELQLAASRYPVVLYTTPDCTPCGDARNLLRGRGVPYSERLVSTSEDSEALQRLSGAREAPTLTLGAQTLRGLSPDTWNAYLDSAGYPRESRLPANYAYPMATPLTERRPVPTAATRNQPPPLVPQASESAAPNPSGSPNPGIRF